MTSSLKDPFAPFDAPFRSFLLRHDLLPPNGPAWSVGVSGGGDSVFLLHLLFRHLPANHSLDILHFDHHTDPQKNARDKDFVTSLAARYGAKLIAGESPSPEKRRPLASETILRKERHDFFTAYLAQHPRSVLFLGHQKDDRIETVLANLFRGTGPRGLVGIPEKNEKIYRPLLFLEREEIRQALREARESYMEDPANLDLGPLRNRIRLELRPAIDRIFPGGTAHLHTLAHHMAQELSFLAPLSTGPLLIVEDPGYVRLSLRLFRALPPSRQAIFSRNILTRQKQWKLPLPPERNLLKTLSTPPSETLRHFPLGAGWHLDIVSDHADLVYLYPDTQNMTIPMGVHLRAKLRNKGNDLSVPLPRSGHLVIDSPVAPSGSYTSGGMPLRPSLSALISAEVIHTGAEDFEIAYRRKDLPLWPSLKPSREITRDTPDQGIGARTVNQLLSRRPIPAAIKDRLPILMFKGKALWIPGWFDRTGELPGAENGPYLSITFQARESSWWKKFLENP
ncbi:MAG: tRNA lysidine(34) synthetase TilS [Leptospirillia bacterium]